MTHAFAADLKHLSSDDLYAAFAGWQTVHQEIFLVSPERAETAFANDWRRLMGDLHAQGYEAAEIKTAASFFGQLLLIAEVTDGEGEDAKTGTAILDANSVSWFDSGNPGAPIDWQMAYAIWRGGQMLKSFNEQA